MNIRKAFLHHIEQSLNTIDAVDLTEHYSDIEPIVQSILMRYSQVRIRELV